MIPAAIPDFEPARLKLLTGLEILDSDCESVFDGLARLAANICEAEVALISLVDENRQWFKSRVGLDICQTERHVSFCSHAILSNEPLIVPDTHEDSRFFDNPLVVMDPKIRFYAGFPLTIEGDLRVGTLCVLSKHPRRLSDFQISSLSLLAIQVVALLKARAIELQKQKMNSEIQEQRLRVASTSKMASLGEMAAGIAHEINNPLTIILAHAGCLVRGASHERIDHAELRRIGESIEKVSWRIGKIVSALRAFSLDGEHERMINCKVDTILNDAIELCRERIVNAGVKFSHESSYPDLSVVCRSVEITQILVNLLNNAFDAVVDQDVKEIEVQIVNSPEFVEIAVLDSGKPISSDIRRKIMEPFFTTKAFGKGTGLGLSISQRIAQAHGGSLVLDDSSAATKFVLRIPRGNRSATESSSNFRMHSVSSKES